MIRSEPFMIPYSRSFQSQPVCHSLMPLRCSRVSILRGCVSAIRAKYLLHIVIINLYVNFLYISNYLFIEPRLIATVSGPYAETRWLTIQNIITPSFHPHRRVVWILSLPLSNVVAFDHAKNI